MCATPAPRVPHAVGVLLGGSGRVRAQTPPSPQLAALLRPAGVTAWVGQGHAVSRTCPATA